MKQLPVILFTQEGYNKIVAEQKQLLVDRTHAVEDLAKARAMGDLSENGYYKSARMKLSSIDHRLRELKYQIRYGKVKAVATTGVVDIGCTVTLDNKKTFTLVGGYESNPQEGKVSHISPMGKALLGKRVADVISVETPNGKVHYTITSLS